VTPEEATPNVAPIAPDTNTITTTYTVDSFGLTDNEVDPVQLAKNYADGLAKGSIAYKVISTVAHAIYTLAIIVIKGYFSVLNQLTAFIADSVSDAVTKDRPEFYTLVAALISDLLQVNVDGAALFNDLKQHGTLPAMQAVGGGLIDLLIGEFTGTANGVGGHVSFSSEVNPETNLPIANLTPAGGVLASKALIGFVLSSAVRQANVDGLVDKIPYGLGALFEKYSEGMRTNLGIGRMMRFALKPYFQDLVARPLTAAINIQYRPKALAVREAFAAWVTGIYDKPTLQAELAAQGYSDVRQGALEWVYKATPTREDLFKLLASGDIDGATFLTWMRRLGYDDDTSALIQQSEERTPVRRVVLQAAEHVASQYLLGKLTQQQMHDLINGLAKSAAGRPLLTAGEVADLTDLPPITAVHHAKQLSVAQLMRMYIFGLITLGEFSDHVTALGYAPGDVTELVEEVLILQKAQAEKAAKEAAKATAPKVAHLSVQKLETAYLDGIITLDVYRAALLAKGFSATDADTQIHETRVKAGIETAHPPTT